jgi:hypothetical protein
MIRLAQQEDMIINIGEKQRGKTVEEIVLKFPDYVSWILSQQNPTGPLLAI